MKTSLSARILSWLQHNPGFHHGEEITRLGQSVGYEGESVRRRIRELVNEGKVETESRKGPRAKSNWYRATLWK